MYTVSVRAEDEAGTQIDLLIERNDHVVNMCELKYYSGSFSVDKDYHQKLIKREELLSSHLAPNEAVHNTLITTHGLERNEYSGIFSKVITLKDLFSD